VVNGFQVREKKEGELKKKKKEKKKK